MTVPTPGSAPDHDAHDQLLIARATAGDTLTPAETAGLAARLEGCVACRELHADLLALTASLRTDLPVARRRRDFRLSPSDAASVRRISWRERVVTILGGPSLRPIAAAVCALGLVLAIGGAVVPGASRQASLATLGGAAIPPGAPSSARGAPQPVDAQSGPGAGGSIATPAATSEGNVAHQAPSPPPSAGQVFGAGESPHASGAPVIAVPLPVGGAGDVTTGVIPPSKAADTAATTGLDLWPVVTVAGVLLFLLGLSGLLAARRRASARL